MKVGVLVVNHCFDTGLATVVDAFNTANELAQMSGMKSARFELEMIGVRRSVTTANGLTVPVGSAKNRAPDIIVIPAIGYKMPDQLEKALTRQEIRDAAELLRRAGGVPRPLAYSRDCLAMVAPPRQPRLPGTDQGSVSARVEQLVTVA